MERRRAILVDGLRRRPCIEKAARNLGATIPHREVQWCEATFVRKVWRRPSVKQFVGDLSMAVARGQVQRARAACSDGVRVCASPEEKSRRLRLTLQARLVQGRRAVPVRLVCLRASRHQSVHDLNEATAGGNVQRRRPSTIGGIDRCAGIDEAPRTTYGLKANHVMQRRRTGSAFIMEDVRQLRTATVAASTVASWPRAPCQDAGAQVVPVGVQIDTYLDAIEDGRTLVHGALVYALQVVVEQMRPQHGPAGTRLDGKIQRREAQRTARLDAREECV